MALAKLFDIDIADHIDNKQVYDYGAFQIDRFPDKDFAVRWRGERGWESGAGEGAAVVGVWRVWGGKIVTKHSADRDRGGSRDFAATRLPAAGSDA